MNCFVCAKEKKNAKFMSIGTYLIPTSKKPILTVLEHLGKFITNGLKVPPDGCVCKMCLNELATYDEYLTKLLKVQRQLTRTIEKSQLDKDQDVLVKNEYIENIKEEFDDVIIEEFQDLSEDAASNNDDNLSNNDAIKVEEIFIDDNFSEEQLEKPISECQLEFSLTNTNSNPEEEQEENEANMKLPVSKTVTCPQCTKGFTNPVRLEYHIAKAHKPLQRCTCTVCGLSLRSEEYLELHMNLHEGKTEKECRYCLKKFTRKTEVIQHMYLHFDKKKFHCAKCGMRFFQYSVLYNHRLQHEAQEVPLICEICNQSFKTKLTHKRHMMTHREDRPRFSCAYCSKTFVEKYTLKVHQRTHDGDVSSSAINENIKQKEISPVAEDMSKLFICIICGCAFINREEYNQHMESQHDVSQLSRISNASGMSQT